MIYVSIVAGIGIPILVFIGYVHYKKSLAYSAEADINVESYPYFYRLPPGWNQDVVFPLYSVVTKLLVKIANNEKLTEEETEKIKTIEKNLDHLIKGGYVGSHREKKNDNKL